MDTTSLDLSAIDPVAATNCIPAELLTDPLFLLVRLGFAVKSRAVEEFEQAGFSPYHHSVLALLDEGARDTQAAIADALQLDRGTLVGLLDSLQQRGLIERQRDPNDRRRHIVTLTAAGRSQLATFRTIISNLSREFLGPLDESERAGLLDVLLRVARHHDPHFAQGSAPALSA
jgi:MarR family transcriptional regulator, lower aerobic nicotinate degradation pathway regulator